MAERLIFTGFLRIIDVVLLNMNNVFHTELVKNMKLAAIGYKEQSVYHIPLEYHIHPI